MLGNLKKVDLNGACPICLEDMNNLKKVVITNCSHAFHEKCMTSQFTINKGVSCPCCRQTSIPMVRVEEPSDGVEENPNIESQMFRALREGDLDYINAALLAEPHLVDKLYENKNNNLKYPLLTLAAMYGHEDIVAFLLDKVTKESIDEFSPDALNALSAACLFGHTKVAELLLNAGAKANNTNVDGVNALWFATCEGKKDLIELLVKFGASVTNKSKENTTALFMAVQQGHLEVVNYLISVIPKAELEEHVNIYSSSKETLTTALYMAAQDGYTDIVSALLSAGADPNQPVDFTQVPLHAAASEGHLEVVKALILRGANVNYQVPNNSATALGYAAEMGHRDVCEYLLRANADPALGYYDDESTPKKQWSAAEIARNNGHVELADYIEHASSIATYRRWYLKLISWKK